MAPAKLVYKREILPDHFRIIHIDTFSISLTQILGKYFPVVKKTTVQLIEYSLGHSSYPTPFPKSNTLVSSHPS